MLPVRRKHAEQEVKRATRQALDLNPLAVLPPDLLNQLTPKQEAWLAARMLTYSDNQACLNVGPKLATLKRWKAEVPAFLACYNTVVLDRLNLAILLNRQMIVRMKRQQMDLLENGSLAVVLRVMEMITKENIAVAAAEGKRNQSLTIIGDSAFEAIRSQALQEQMEAGLFAERVIGRPIELPGEAVGLLPDSLETSSESGGIHSDTGRDGLSDAAVYPVAVAGGISSAVHDEQVPDLPEGEAAGDLVVLGLTLPLDSYFPSEQ